MTQSHSFASAWAGGQAAVSEAVTEAVTGLGGERAALVLFFADAEQRPARVAERASSSAGGALLAGISSTGLMTTQGLRRGGCVAMAFGGDGLAVGVGVATHASRDPRAAGSAAAASAIQGLHLDAGNAVVLLFLDPQSGDEGRAIDGAYDVVGGRVPLAGGGANGSDPALYAGDAAHADAVVAVALGCSSAVSVSSAHGCRPCGVPALVTRARGPTVMELDGRPAESVYLELVGRPAAALTDEEFEALAVLHPLAQPELSGNVRLRHVSGRAVGGGLACVTPIPQNAAVWLAEQNGSTIVRSAARAGSVVTEELPGPPRAAIVFDCAARERALGARAAEEAQALVTAFGSEIAVAGLYTRGEVGRTRGSKGDLNHAIVVVGFE